MWSRLGAGTALLTGMLVFGLAPAVSAEEPVDLGGAYVVDEVGALSGRENQVQAALDELYDRADIQLFVVFVSEFDNPSNAVDWADATAIDNNLGVRDVLLAVAVDDRAYAFSIDPSFPLDDDQFDRVELETESYLAGDDWAGAVIASAQTIQAEATGVVGPGPDPQPSNGAGESSGGGIPVLPIVGGVAVVGVGVFIFSRIRKRSKEGKVTANPDGMTQQELDRRAGSLLVQLDDSLKTSEQELGFAVAQFGEEATADFAKTLQSAKEKVAQAFTIQQQLDDATPESADQKRALTTQIIQLCESADADLDAQADAFDELRSLEKNVPQALEQVRKDAAAAATARDAAARSLDALTAAYAATAIEPVAGNLEQADKLLAFADESAKRADQAVLDGTPSAAAIAVRTAQASVGQVEQLFAAIEQLSANLADASGKLDAVVADTTQDIAAARTLPEDARLTPAIAAAESALAQAQAAKGDPVTALAHLTEANTALEQVFTGVRSEQEQVAHARTQLDGAISGARAQIQAAAEFISTRRGGVSSTPRTRVSEADRHLTQAVALAATDPIQALREAQSAQQLAASAMSAARSDVSYFEQQQLAREQSYYSDYRGSDGADLGGLLGGLFDGGGSSSGWFSGGGSSSSSSGWRSSRSSRSGGFGGSSRSGRGGGFGGGSRSSGRSRSSRSGGGRSRGGRF